MSKLTPEQAQVLEEMASANRFLFFQIKTLDMPFETRMALAHPFDGVLERSSALMATIGKEFESISSTLADQS